MEKSNNSTTLCASLDPLEQPEAQTLVTSLMQSAGTAVFILDEGKFRHVNKTFEELTGYTAGELSGTRSLNLVHPDDKEMVRTKAIENLKGMELHRPYIYRLVKKNGEALWVQEKVASARYRVKKATIGCFIDITQNKKAEDELKNSEERLNILFEYAPDAYYLSDLRGTFTDGNRAAEMLTGYKREELVGKSFMKLKLLSSDQLLRAARLLAKNALGYSTGPDEFTITVKNGGRIAIEIRTYPVTIEGKVQVLGIARDISERKRAERELEKMTRELGERVKELNCLYQISNLKTATGLSLPVLLQKIVNIIPSAWQYPGQTCAQIALDGHAYTSGHFRKTGLKQSAALVIGDELQGSIDVFYTGKKYADDERLFLEEEAHLLTLIAQHVVDIVRRRDIERVKKEADEKFEAISQSAQDAIIMVNDSGHITYWNKAAEIIFGYSVKDALGKDLHATIAPERDYSLFQKAIKTFGKTGKGKAIGQTLEMVGVKKDGGEFPIELSLSSIQIKGQWHAIGIVRDITRRKRAEEKLAHLASHDPLTGLPNRALFDDRLTMALAGAQRTGQQFAVLVIDMDRFKQVNDTLGHHMGDRLLQATGDRLVNVLRKSDTVARMGGDEFFILAAITGPANAEQIARKILKAFQEPFVIESNEIEANLSIGVSLYPQDGEDAITLTKNADIAMYHAKESGRNRYHLYSAKIPVHG